VSATPAGRVELRPVRYEIITNCYSPASRAAISGDASRISEAISAVVSIASTASANHHSGHWGGLLADPAVILAHAIANIVSLDGRILVPGRTPAVIPNSIRQASHDIVIEDLPGTPVPDPGWGDAAET
jgi:hypothetical protein